MSGNERTRIKKKRRTVEPPQFPGPTIGWGQETAVGSEKTEGRDKAAFKNSQVDVFEIELPRDADHKCYLKHFTHLYEPVLSGEAEPSPMLVPVNESCPIPERSAEVDKPVVVSSISSPGIKLLHVVSITPSKVFLPPGGSY